MKKLWKFKMLVMAVMLVMTRVPFCFGAVSPEEAAKLGTTLTGVGAEMAGNKEGTIPPYIGGLTKAPASYKPGSGIYTDPFATEKPLFSINAQNMAQYADKLTEGTKALMKRFPTYRIDVYKTHRTVAYPDIVIKNTSKAAVKAKTTNGGLTVKDAHAAIPFPIPKDGYEAMWNHMLRYMGRADDLKWESITVDSSGKVLVTLAATVHEEYPYYDEDPARPDADLCWRAMWFVHGPIRRVGEAGMIDDSINPYNKPRVAYQYLPGQRRIKLAPEIGFDTPSFTTSGAATYDQVKMYNGSMERYNMKLIGKREIYVPYNTYRAFCQVKREELYGPKHLNPDHVRWELHRVWVVEGNLKPGMRHIYYKRTFYLEEDSWSLSAIENYDKIGNLFTVDFGHQTPLYDVPAPFSNFAISYNLISNCYSGDYWLGPDGFIRRSEVWPLRQWSPSRLAGAGVR